MCSFEFVMWKYVPCRQAAQIHSPGAAESISDETNPGKGCMPLLKEAVDGIWCGFQWK